MIQSDKIVALVNECLGKEALQELTDEDIIIFAGHILMRIGAYLYWKDSDRLNIPTKLDETMIENLEDSAGGMFIKAGWRIQNGIWKKGQNER